MMCLYGVQWLDFMLKMIVYYAVVTLHQGSASKFGIGPKKKNSPLDELPVADCYGVFCNW